MAHVVLINPRFEVSFWGQEYVLPFMGKRAVSPALALPLLAALTPRSHSVTIIDENVDSIDFDAIASADIVGVTGMSVQRLRMREILAELNRRGSFTVVGGPWVSANESYFEDLADVIFVGEADDSWPRFLAEWQNGVHSTRYEQHERTDMRKLPTPRFDLLKMEHYLCGTVQISRGCPYRCDFCDIIAIFGRKPRLKTARQVIDELEALRQQGMRSVFIVDDNFIGNKKQIKILLEELIKYQKKYAYAFRFNTQASLDLSEEVQLMQLMTEANFTRVFIGIESPNLAALGEASKLHNIDKGATLVDRVNRIQDAGLEVEAGMILGFDADTSAVFRAQVEFIREARIIVAMVGMLYAIPGTPLHTRLAADGRIDECDLSEYGTNVIPLQLSRDELRAGYIEVMNDIYNPVAFFDRLESLFLIGSLRFTRDAMFLKRKAPLIWLRRGTLDAVATLVLLKRILVNLPDKKLARFYFWKVLRFASKRPDPSFLLYIVATCAFHYHAYKLSENLVMDSGSMVNAI